MWWVDVACMHDVHVLPVTCSSSMECNNSLPIRLHDRTVGAGLGRCVGGSVFKLEATVISGSLVALASGVLLHSPAALQIYARVTIIHCGLKG